MKKLLIFLSIILILTGCVNSTLKEEPLEYEDQLEELKGQYIKLSCGEFDGGSSFEIKNYGCRKRDIYFNYNERIIYTEFDNTFAGGMINEIIYNDYFYRIYKDKEPDSVIDTSRGIENTTFMNIEQVLTFLAIINAFDQEEKVVVYDKKSLHWEEIANFFTLTMRESQTWENYEDAPCRVVEITVTKKNENTVVITADEEECQNVEGDLVDNTDEIEVTINVDEKEFMDTYNDLVSQIEPVE